MRRRCEVCADDDALDDGRLCADCSRARRARLSWTPREAGAPKLTEADVFRVSGLKPPDDAAGVARRYPRAR